MKKGLAFFISMILLLSGFAAFTVSAETTTPQNNRPLATNELQQLTYLPSKEKLISVGLTSSNHCQRLGDKNLTPEIAADIADIKYGISLIGLKWTTAHKVSAISDGIWSVWETGEKKEQGDLSWTPSGALYNINGKEDTADARYISLLTYNFGKVMDLEAFGYFTNNMAGMSSVMDVYTSNNGTDWTLIGKYDGIQLRMENKNFKNAATQTFPDSLGKTINNLPLWSLDNKSAQYLRFGIVKGRSVKGDGTNYDSYTDMGSIAQRELVIFGSESRSSILPEIPENQVASYAGMQTSTVSNNTYSVRFVGTTQDLAGSEVGFKVTASYGSGNNANFDTACKSVYQSILGSADTGITYSYTAKELGGNYVFALSVTEIPVSVGTVTFHVTPYKLINGKLNTGVSYNITVNAGNLISQFAVSE